MSTATTTRLVQRKAPSPLSSGLTSPLASLHTAIRRYVVLETLALLVLAASIWSLVSLCFDWGIFFKLFGFDYLREGSPGVQTFLRTSALLILVGVAGWIIWRYLVVRMLKPLTASDLAMALERRYPRALADRLITAVELNDIEEAARKGYSRSMLEATARRAEESLQGLNVGDVLNTQRLHKRLGLATVCLLIATLLFLLLPEILQTWAERNVQYRRTLWPREAILEFTDFQNRNKAVPVGSEWKAVIRSARWAVKDASSSEGWRPLMPDDIQSPNTPWELVDMQKDTLLSFLPADWHHWSLDRIESNLITEGAQRELGLTWASQALQQLKSAQDALPDSIRSFLPESMQKFSPQQVSQVLELARTLSREDAIRLQKELFTLRPVSNDMVWTVASMHQTGLPIPLSSMAFIQKLAYDRDANAPAFAMPAADWNRLPVDWQKLAIRDLSKRLKLFAESESADALGQRVASQGKAFFADLQARAALTSFATRKAFRQLTIPDKITLEFENLSEVDARGKAKRGQPEVKRQPSSNEFQYEFKKVDRPMRLRALSSQTSTPWYRVDVKPLPTLKSLVRWQEEPGYLHSSASKVRIGPLVMPVDGEETRVQAPFGSLVRIEGESHKALSDVKATADLPEQNPEVELQSDQVTFQLRFTNPLREDVRLKLTLKDQDGISAERTLLILMTPDKSPEFIKGQFEALNRKFVTNKAVLPLSVSVRDDVALLALEYDVNILKNDRTSVHQFRVPLRTFEPYPEVPAMPGGLNFENREDVTLPRLLTHYNQAATGAPMYHLSRLGALPAGWMVLMPDWNFGLLKEYSRDYVDRAMSGPVYTNKDEYLDTLALRTLAKKPITEPLLETPYRMVIRIVARDNRMNQGKPGHQEGYSSESFEFNVVSEQDVLIEGGRREEDLRDQFEESIQALRKVRNGLKRIRDEIDTSTPAKAEDVRRGMNDAQDATRSLAQIRAALDEKVLREFRQIYREFYLCRVDERVLNRIDQRICNPLSILLQPEQGFAKLESGVDTLARRLESEGSSLPKSLLQDPVSQADRVLQKLEEILNDMRKLIEFNEALRVLRDLINNEQKLVDEMKKLIQQKLKNDLDDR